MTAKKDLEAIYPLSAMQEGMLFYTLYEPHSALYFEQFTFLIHGPVDEALLHQAWQTMLNRHPILRTGFVWKKQEAPLQVVFKQVLLPWQSLDWRHFAPETAEEELERYLLDERLRGFDLTTPPLCKVTLIRLGEETYRFVWSHHHLLLDGWSLPILLQEAFTTYEALVAGKPNPLPPVRPYRDFINWLQQRDKEAEQRFWKEVLHEFHDPISVIDAVGGNSNPVEKAASYQSHQFDLSPELTKQLVQVTREERLTLSTLCYGAWALLLQRYSGKDDVMFGVTMAGRPPELQGVERMVGLFINTLPLRTLVSPTTPLGAWLQALQEQQARLRSHEHTPLRFIQEWSYVAAGTQLFDSLVVFENYPIQNEQLGHDQASLRLSDFRAEERTNYALTLVASLADSRLRIDLIYDANAFTQSQIQQIAGHLTTVLSQIPTSLSRPLSTLSILTETETERLLHTWNTTSRSLPSQTCVHRLIEAQARQQPNALAIQKGDYALTYGELDRRANQLARKLQALGVGPEKWVALCTESGPELFVGILAVWKAGGAYIPMDPTFPKERLAFMLSDAAPTAILTHSHLKDHLPSTVPLLMLDNPENFSADDSSVESAVGLDNIAYIIFTSGSTGLPKGTAISHAGLLNLLNWYMTAFEISPSSRSSQVANPAFDASILDSWPYLVAGGSLHFPPTPAESAPPKLLEWIKAEGITHCFIVTPLAELALQSHWPEEMPLQFLLTGGDRLHMGKPPWLTCAFINAYGPTEDTVVTTSFTVDRQPSPPIGRPLPNKQLYILDKQLNPVPVGVSGELYIGGVGLARCYLNRPDLTAERFIPNPFLKGQVERIAAETGESQEAILARLPAHAFRLYRTGDMARYLPDGSVECLGRLDGQIKISGYRIELGEIERTLALHPAVEKALVTVWQNRLGNKQLLAYFTSKSKMLPSLRELERFLKRHLPGYMVPNSIFVLKEIPYMLNGSKIDRKALPVPEDLELAGTRIVKPRTDIEKRLVEVWQQVLKIDEIGIENNFFELGGDSILSIQLVSRAGQVGLHFTVKQIFRYPTIAELAPHVSLNAPVVTEQGHVVGPMPLTPVQHWFFEQPLPTPQHYNQSFLLVERQPMEPKWVEQAVNQLVSHHDALRTQYRRTPDGWEQQVNAPEMAVDFTVVDLSETPDESLAPAIERLASQAQASLDLASGLPMRCIWFHAGQGRPNRFLWAIHHLVVDGISWRVLLEDLQTAYNQCRRGETPKLPAKTTSFKRWAERLKNAVETEGLFANEQEKWLHNFQAPIGQSPIDHPENLSDNSEATTARVDIALSLEETQRLLYDVPQALNITINDILLTALGQTLSEWTKNHRVLIDLEGHGRADFLSDVDLSRTVGWFTSMYPILLDIRATQGLDAVIKSVKEHLHQITNQGIGFGCLRYLSPDETIRARFAALPKAEVRFNYMGQYDQGFDTGVLLVPSQESIGPALSPDTPRTHLLDIAGAVLMEQLRFTWMYSTRLYKPETVKRLAETYANHLRQIIEYAQSSQVAPLLTPTDFPSANLNQEELDQFLTSIQIA